MVLKRKDLLLELRGHEANIIQWGKMIDIGEIVAEALQKAIESYPEEEDAPIHNDEGNKEER